MKPIQTLLFVAGIVFFFTIIIGLAYWHFQECRMVGHSTLYCIVFSGK